MSMFLSLMSILGNLTLSLFIPLTAFSFYRYRLGRKEEEYDKIISTLKLEETGASLSVPAIKNEYSSVDYVLPVFFSTALCLLGFTALFFGTSFGLDSKHLLLSGTYSGLDIEGYQTMSLCALTYAFLGSYIWSVQNIFRRLVTIDLPPGAYYTIGIRIILSAFIALAIRHLLYSVPGDSQSYAMGSLPVVAFLTGMFPERGIHYLKERVKIFSDKGIPRADNLPLDMIEGINIFHKVRLEEVGIDNAQNLAKANLVELLVRTPFKPKEIIDWIGQARLYLYFKSEVKKLRGVGIRTIFDFKIIGSAEGQLSEVAQSTEISELRLNSVYQIIKDDPGVDRLFNAANTLGVL